MDEKELIIQVVSGNYNAFGFLVRRYQNLVLHIVGRMIVNQHDIEDVCQEVFIRVYRKLGDFRGDSRLSTWIASIAYNQAITYLKKKKQYPLAGPEREVAMESFPDESNPQQLLETAETIAMLKASVAELPLQYRTAITLFYLGEFSYREMEEITGLPEGTIKIHLFRGRQLLKEKLLNSQKTIGALCHEYS